MNYWIRAGFLANLPVAASVIAYGSVLGVLAAQQGVTGFQLMMMNLLIFAGSSQLVMIEMWPAPLPVLEVTLAILMINLRYFLASASLHPLFRGYGLLYKFAAVHLVVDENWAITMAAHRQKGVTPAFLVGGGICLLMAWCTGTFLGHQLGNVIRNPEAYALDFAFTAVFTALLFSLWRSKGDILSWILAALLALISEALLPGKWYILIGGVGGASLAALRAPSLQTQENT